MILYTINTILFIFNMGCFHCFQQSDKEDKVLISARLTPTMEIQFHYENESSFLGYPYYSHLVKELASLFKLNTKQWLSYE